MATLDEDIVGGAGTGEEDTTRKNRQSLAKSFLIGRRVSRSARLIPWLTFGLRKKWKIAVPEITSICISENL